MADDVIDFLRVNFAQVNARLDTIDRKQAEMIQRAGALEIGVAGVRRDIAALSEGTAHLSVRIDHLAERIDHIERRLDLSEAAP